MAQLIDTNIDGTLIVSDESTVNGVYNNGSEYVEGQLTVSGEVYLNDEYFINLWNSLGV